jgi:hypothetical protein
LANAQMITRGISLNAQTAKAAKPGKMQRLFDARLGLPPESERSGTLGTRLVAFRHLRSPGRVGGRGFPKFAPDRLPNHQADLPRRLRQTPVQTVGEIPESTVAQDDFNSLPLKQFRPLVCPHCGASLDHFMGAAGIALMNHRSLDWWTLMAAKRSPVLSSAIVHYRFEAIHRFADGNGRPGRALALWALYRRGFDTHHIFSVDEFYWEDRPCYYAALEAVRQEGEDLSRWLEYTAEGLRVTLERVWTRVLKFSARSRKAKLVLRPKQEQLLQLLRDHPSMIPHEIWDSLGVTRQGAIKLIQPLVDAGLARRIGTRKSGRYLLA